MEFHPNQINAAYEILGHLKSKKNFIVMRALEQSGKTGTAQCLIDLLNEETDRFGRVLVIYLTHLSSNSLKNQTEDRIVAHRREKLKTNSKYSSILNWHRNDLKVEKSLAEFREKMKLHDRLLIISDECHEAITEGGNLDHFFKEELNVPLSDYKNNKRSGL